MDLGLQDATAVVSGGSKGMGARRVPRRRGARSPCSLAQARRRDGRGDARAGSPDAVGIHRPHVCG
jgi:hypothetical protein